MTSSSSLPFGAFPPAVAEAAQQWVLLSHDPAFTDWDGLTLWLEADSAHLAAYEWALDTDAWAADMVARLPDMPALEDPKAPRNDALRYVDRQYPASRPRTALRKRLFGGAIAAGIGALGLWVAIAMQGPHLTQITTAAGEHRVIALQDGSRITLNGATRIAYDPDAPRYVELAEGEALFHIRHDAANPFVVMAGKTRLLDAGTVFNVTQSGGALDVAVAEGAVIYAPDAEAIELRAGDALSRANAHARPQLRHTMPQAVGSWQSGILQYDTAPMTQVARDLARTLGTPITVDESAKHMVFSGTLMLSGAPDAIFQRIGPLMGVQFVPQPAATGKRSGQGEGWRITPPNDSRH